MPPKNCEFPGLSPLYPQILDGLGRSLLRYFFDRVSLHIARQRSIFYLRFRRRKSEKALVSERFFFNLTVDYCKYTVDSCKLMTVENPSTNRRIRPPMLKIIGSEAILCFGWDMTMLNLLDFIHSLNIFIRKISGGVGFYALFTQKRHLEIKACHAHPKHKIVARMVFKS